MIDVHRPRQAGDFPVSQCHKVVHNLHDAADIVRVDVGDFRVFHSVFHQHNGNSLIHDPGNQAFFQIGGDQEGSLDIIVEEPLVDLFRVGCAGQGVDHNPITIFLEDDS